MTENSDYIDSSEPSYFDTVHDAQAAIDDNALLWRQRADAMMFLISEGLK